eukprot:1794098-Amphidinium_carterae.1
MDHAAEGPCPKGACRLPTLPELGLNLSVQPDLVDGQSTVSRMAGRGASYVLRVHFLGFRKPLRRAPAKTRPL